MLLRQNLNISIRVHTLGRDAPHNAHANAAFMLYIDNNTDTHTLRSHLG